MPEVRITLRESDENRNLVVPFLQEQLGKNLGVDLKAELLDSKTYQQRYAESQSQFVLGDWHADYPD